MLIFTAWNHSQIPAAIWKNMDRELSGFSLPHINMCARRSADVIGR